MALWIALAVGAAALIGIALLAWRWFSRRRSVVFELGNERAIPIARFASGQRGKIVGTLEYEGEPLVSPLTGRTCAYYHITVEELVAGANTVNAVNTTDRAWYQVIREETRLHFIIADSSGRAFIDTGAADVAADICVSILSGPLTHPSELEEHFLATHGPRDKHWFVGKTLRYKEGILEAGEKVSVYGEGHLEPEPLPPSPNDHGDGGKVKDSQNSDNDENSPIRIIEIEHPLASQLHMAGDYDHPLLISDNRMTLR